MLDRIIWNGSSSGMYTVKSAYRFAIEVLETNEHFFVSGDWQKLWKAEVPYKVRYFAWRMSRDCIPHRINLQRKGIDVPGSCGLCDTNMESSWHLFVDCSFAKQVWREVDLLDFIGTN